MSKYARQNLLFAFAGFIFLLAGFRDLYWPGSFTLNRAMPGRGEVGIAMALGLFFIGFAALRAVRRGD